MEKLSQLHGDIRRSGRWDLIVVDTPPSRSALDFLDAPDRLASFLDGRFIRLLVAPARGPARLLSAGLGAVSGALTKVLGAQLLRDAQAFVAAFDTLFGGFRQRAEQTFRLLQAAETAFVVVAAPQSDALREAAYFVERLNQEHMPLAGLVVNRVTTDQVSDLSGPVAAAAAQRLERKGAHLVTAHLLRLHAERVAAIDREEHLEARFSAAHPKVAVARVPALSTDVHDLAALRTVGAALTAFG